MWPPAQRFAELASNFDRQVANGGICEAARWILPRFCQSIDCTQEREIPTEGPLLVLSNHPGGVDGLLIAAALPRDDLKIVASGVPFIRGLPHTGNSLIYSSHDTHARMSVIRQMIRHLKADGSVLIFPSGTVDPDPSLILGAAQALRDWSPSVSLLIRKVPQVRVVVGMVSGVLSPASLRNPLIRLRHGQRQRQKLAEFLQISRQLFFPRSVSISPKITLGKLLSFEDILVDGRDAIRCMIESEANRLLHLHTASE
jgi:hypothetical protein